MRIILPLLLLLGLVFYWALRPAPPLFPVRSDRSYSPPYQPLRGVLSATQDGVLALDAHGALLAWGNNDELQLGLSRREVYRLPAPVPSPRRWHAIFAGDQDSYGIDTGGHLFRLGRTLDNDASASRGFQPLFTDDSWVKVQARWLLGAGLTNTGRLTVWNERDMDRFLAPGQMASDPRQLPVLPRQSWADFCVGQGDLVAVADDGSLWRSDPPPGPGQNVLAPASAADPQPEQLGLHRIEAPARFVRVYCRENAGQVLVLDDQHRLWGFGRDPFAELGDGGPTYQQGRAVAESDIKQLNPLHWLELAVGTQYSLGIAGDGSLWAWGSNSGGRLGTGDSDSRTGPTLVDKSHRWLALAAGYETAFALAGDGTLYAWGGNGAGLLGDGGVAGTRLLPTPVVSSARWPGSE